MHNDKNAYRRLESDSEEEEIVNTNSQNNNIIKNHPKIKVQEEI